MTRGGGDTPLALPTRRGRRPGRSRFAVRPSRSLIRSNFPASGRIGTRQSTCHPPGVMTRRTREIMTTPWRPLGSAYSQGEGGALLQSPEGAREGLEKNAWFETKLFGVSHA
jgi:hypothetical protein